MEDDDVEFQTNINANKTNTKLEKMQIMEDNASVASQTAGSNFGTGISNLGIRNKKKDNILEYGGFNKIKIICIFVILIAILIICIEYFVLKTLVRQTKENNFYYLDYRDFSKLYYQLFSSILSISCIYNNGTCLRIIDPYINQYSKTKGINFNFAGMILMQTEILAEKMMKRRTILNNVHKCIGNEQYNTLFGNNLDYLRVSQNIINGKYYYNLTIVKRQFSEILLSMCNTFKILTETMNFTIGFLNGTNDPFNTFNSLDTNYYLNDYQKEFYELILNYRNYNERFNVINEKLTDIILSKSKVVEVFVYLSISIDAFLIIIIGTLMYSYSLLFESILIKIINYLNMIMNIKSDEFNFNEIFSKKLENLESILNFYNSDPIKGMHNLNSLYSGYQQYLSTKNKNISENKKNYKKIEENKKNELDDVPKNQRIINRKDVKSLRITFIYIFIYYVVIFVIIVLYIILLILWINYFKNKGHVFKLFEKNYLLEAIVYRSINTFELMFFNNLTMYEVTHFILDENKIKQENALLKDFYENLKYVFNNKKEKNIVGNIFQDIENYGSFSCQTLYMLNSDKIKEIESRAKEKNLLDIINVSDNLIQLCEDSNVSESKDYRTVFERHIQFIRNGINND